MESKRMPEIRFPGFGEEWEQVKIDKIVEDFAEKTTVQDQYPVLTSSQTHGIMLQDDYFTNGQVPNKNNIGYFILPRGYFTFRSRSDNGVFKFNRNDLIEKGIISYFYPVFKLSRGNSDFFLNMLNSTIKKEVAIEAEGTGQKVLSLKKFKNINVILPENKEQEEIGNFFKQLDDMIALLQQELDILKQTKQGFIQKMFPKEGESVPEIRFPGFTGEWEQRKLKDIAKFNPRAELPSEFEYVDLESVKGTELISHRTETRQAAPSRAQRVAKRGDVFYQTVRPYQKNNYLFDLPFDNYVFSTGYAQMRPYIDSYFLLSRIQEERFVSKVLNRSTGTSYPAINSNDLAQIEISIPMLKEEQIKIGNFFKQLDDTIALQEKELETLKQTKKAFLQKMFV